MTRGAPHESARSVAVEVVYAVDVDGAYANLTLPRLLRGHRLDAREAALATELAYGTLRRLGSIDAVLARASHRPLAQLDPIVRSALRVGAYQLLHTRVAPHAAVHETVELVRRRAGERPVGFVNAVLRRVAERTWEQWVDRLDPTDGLDRLAMQRGYPRWIAEAFLAALEGDTAELDTALVDEPPTVHLAARPGRITRDALLAEAGAGSTAGPSSPYAVHLLAGDPAGLSAVRSGAAGVQDEGSQLAALALANAPVAGPDRRWLDLCAGPGGKSALLDGLAAQRGAALVAADVHPHRARLVQSVLRAPRVVVADGRRPPWRPRTFDRVLLDAPCSGLGALRRRPDARWRRGPQDVPPLSDLQVELLIAALELTRTGGVVGYVTCSPHPAETIEVIARVRTRRPDIELLDARAELPGVPRLGAGPMAQLWPHRHGTDAMFVALLRPSSGPRGGRSIHSHQP